MRWIGPNRSRSPALRRNRTPGSVHRRASARSRTAHAAVSRTALWQSWDIPGK
ncbi:hypothetical protein KCH_54040 [Kitasatospora cheerisanensis KCTC 2395]|uniref:Uncharacterized protein n=1 Tax=Kitasatospora cheerisanensis KCTC 2395 TaxID=1348663 RepID=A0A066YY10_9ACTN|nr:hypothetical protein KCH_54040 [Kitasatospora cheerisanensis KCTC 2395]